MLALGLLAGCSSDARRDVTEIRFWNGFTGPDGAKMLEIVREFNRQNPDVRVSMQRIEWGTYYNKLFVAGTAGRAPDVFVLHSSALARFVQGRFLLPLDKRIDASFPDSDVDPNVWDAATLDGQRWGLPLDVHSLGMFYNRGLVAKPPRTREEFLAVAQAHSVDGKWGFGFANPGPTAYSVMNQFGGRFFSPDGRRCVMNNPENQAALQFCADLIWRYKVAPPLEADAWTAFRQGRVAMTFNGIFMLPDLAKQADLSFAGAPVPAVGPEAAVWASSHTLCLRAGMAGAKTEAGWRFVRFLSDHSLEWASAGQVPVRRTLRQSPEFAGMPVQREFAKQIPYVRYMPATPVVFEFETALNFAVERVLRQSASPADALAEAEAKINQTLDRRHAALARSLAEAR